MKLLSGKYLRFGRALRSSAFLFVWIGQTLSALGDGAYYVAIAWQVLLLTNSAIAIGNVLLASTLPRLLFLLLGGVVADRLPRRLVMLYSDSGRALVLLLVAVLGWLHWLQLWHLIGLSLVFGIADSFFTPAYNALVPQLVIAEDLPSANALTTLGWQTSQLLGPVIGAGCIALAGAATAFAFDGLTFVVSIGTLLVVHLPMQSVPKDEAQVEHSTPLMNVRRVITDVRDGMRFIIRSPFLFVTLLVAVVANVGSGAIDVALPKLVRNFYHASSWLLGLLTTTFFLGVLLATWFVGQMGRIIHRRALVGYLCLFPSGLGYIVLGLPWSRGLAPIISCVVYAIIGISGGIFGLFYTTLTQEVVPNDMMGRVGSIQVLSLYCMMPLGLVLGGVVTEGIGPNWVFIASGVLSIVLVCCALSVPAIRTMD